MVTKEVKAPSSFVFINYSDPAHDRLNKNNKHLVTKTATIHACRTRKRRTSSRSGLAVSPAAVSEPQIPIESDYTTLSTLHSSTSTPISLEESSSTSSPHSTATLATASTLSRGLLGSDNQYAETQELICTNHQTHERLHVGLSTALTCASTDPFDTLPVKPNQKIWKLLSSWLSAGARVNHAADDGYRTQVAEIRKAFYWPLLNRNKATFHAAVAWIALATNEESMRPILDASLATAMPALRDSLLDAGDDNAESAWYTIILLLSVAVRLGDTAAQEAHYRGLASLLARRSDLVTSSTQNSIPSTSSFLYVFVSAVILANYDSYRKEPSLAYLPKYVLNTSEAITASLNDQDISTGFAPLREQGTISSFLYYTFRHIIPLQVLYPKARQNELSTEDAAALINGIWCCQLSLTVPQPRSTEMEELIWMGATIYSHTERRYWTAVAGIALGLTPRLQNLSLHHLLDHSTDRTLYAETLLWLYISAGSHVQDETSKHSLGTTVAWLARETFAIHHLDDVHRVLRHFLWSEVADSQAATFWQGYCHPPRSFSSPQHQQEHQHQLQH